MRWKWIFHSCIWMGQKLDVICQTGYLPRYPSINLIFAIHIVSHKFRYINTERKWIHHKPRAWRISQFEPHTHTHKMNDVFAFFFFTLFFFIFFVGNDALCSSLLNYYLLSLFNKSSLLRPSFCFTISIAPVESLRVFSCATVFRSEYMKWIHKHIMIFNIILCCCCLYRIDNVVKCLIFHFLKRKFPSNGIWSGLMLQVDRNEIHLGCFFVPNGLLSFNGRDRSIRKRSTAIISNACDSFSHSVSIMPVEIEWKIHFSLCTTLYYWSQIRW